MTSLFLDESRDFSVCFLRYSPVFSENTGEYLKKQTEKTLDSSKNKEVIDTIKKDSKVSTFNQNET